MDMSVCVLVVLSMVFSGANAKFDCRRGAGNELCQHSGVCSSLSSDCTGCDATFEGADCSIDTGTTCDSNPCQNGGICYAVDGMVPTCYCSVKYMGVNCADERYKLVCDYATSQMKITITAQATTFAGIIYMDGKKDTCTFNNGGEKLITHTDTACGDAGVKGEDQNKVYERKVVVQYDTATMRPSDEKVTFICGSSESVFLTVSGVTVTAIVDGMNKISQGSAAVAGDVSMVRSPAGSPLDFGTQIEFTIRVTDDGTTNGFKDVSIRSCQLQEKETDPTVEVKLIDNFCPVKGANGVMKLYTDQYISRNAKERKFTVAAIYLASPTGVFDTMVVTCRVLVCVDVADCADDIETCDPPAQQSNGRRKRQAGVKEESLNLNFTIINPVSDKQATRQHLDDTACYQTWEMNVTLAVLGVGLLLVLVVCLVLAVKVILHRKSETAMGKC